MTTHFFALVNENKIDSIRRLLVNQDLQQSLQGLFDSQQSEFIPAGIDLVPFDARYTVDESEVFTIDGFTLPSMFVDAVQAPRSVPQLVVNVSNSSRIKSVFAGGHTSDGDTTLQFQSFNRSRLLVTGFTILHQGNTFGSTINDVRELIFGHPISSNFERWRA